MVQLAQIMITVLFSTTPNDVRKQILKKLCDKWRIAVHGPEKDLVIPLARRIGPIVKKKAQNENHLLQPGGGKASMLKPMSRRASAISITSVLHEQQEMNVETRSSDKYIAIPLPNHTGAE